MTTPTIPMTARGLNGRSPGRLFQAISEQNVNIIAIAQGSNELTISVVVARDELERLRVQAPRRAAVSRQDQSLCQTESVPDFCTCGAQLPPDARFCHKCGKPQFEYPIVAEEIAEPAPPPVPVDGPKAPLEIGFHNGLAVRIGFFAATAAVVMFLFPLPNPFLRLLAFLIAGFLAVFLYIRRTGQGLTIRGGARMGWITGIFCFLLVGVLATASMVWNANQEGLAKFLSKQLPPNDARTDSMVQMLQDPASLAAVVLFMLIVLFIIVTALPMIGGALGAKLFEKDGAQS